MSRDKHSKTERGAKASSPQQLHRAGWNETLKRVWVNSGTHHLGLMAAGVAFYAFLSFAPLLAALVLSYGLFADPAAVPGHLRRIIDIVPPEAATLINEQLINLIQGARGKQGIGLGVAVAVSLFSASRASRAMIDALNVIYEESDRRGLIRSSIVSILLIAAAVATGLAGLAAAALLGLAGRWFTGSASIIADVLGILSWPVAGALCCLMLGIVYRFAPDRSDARWQWLSVGAVLGTILWLIATLLFGIYAANFGSYGATYGSLGAVAVLLMWLYVSAYAVLVGALVNAEAERQTARDSTTGAPRPMGQRGARVADMSAAIE